MAGITGLNRDHLAHVLASYGKKQATKGGRAPCGKLSASLMRGIIDFPIAPKEPGYISVMNIRPC
jgi:hypothetical protein